MRLSIELKDHNGRGQFTKTELLKTDFWHLNYYRVPNEYLNPTSPYKEYVLYLQGFDANNNPVGQTYEESLLPPFYTLDDSGQGAVLTCDGTCNGSDYAWTVEQWTPVDIDGNLAGSAYYKLRTAVDYIGFEGSNFGLPVPYYAYYGRYYFENSILSSGVLASPLNAYFEVNGWSLSFPQYNGSGPSAVPRVILFENEGGYEDPNEIQILPWLEDQVVGIHKGRGPWANEVIQTSNLVNPVNFCGTATSIQAWTNVINLYSNIDDLDVPLLSCDGGLVTGNLPSGPTYTAGCFDDYCYSFDGDEGGFWDAWYSYVKNLATTNNHPGISAAHPSNGLKQIVIQELKPSGWTTILNERASDMFAADGTYIHPFNTLNKGMYRIWSLAENGKLYPSIFEMTDTAPVSYDLSNFLDVVVFPNPTSDGLLSFQIDADKDLRVRHRILDHQGNAIYSNTFAIRDGHSETHKVALSNLPQGNFILSVFEFADGSTKTTTILIQP